MRLHQIGINSVSTSGDSLAERLDAYAGAGFSKVEFQLGQVKSHMAAGGSPEEVRTMLDERGLECTGGFETHLAVFATTPERERNHAVILENARLLQMLGGTCLVVGTDGPSSPVEDPLGEIAEVFGDLASEMARYEVNLALEFNWSPVVKSLRTAVEVARRAGQPNGGVLFDSAHYHCTPTKFDQIDAEAVRAIKNVHVNDMRDKPGELSNCNADRELPGEGHLDLRSIFGRIAGFGYTGNYMIEMFSDRLWALPAAAAARLMYQSMVTLC